MGPDVPHGPQSVARLRALQAITEAALAHLDFDDLVRELLDRLTAILDVDTAAVLLLDEDRAELVARAAKGLEEEVEAEVRIPVGRGFAGRIAAERRPVFIPDVEHADIVNPILREKGLRSLLGVPLLVQGDLIGVLHVGSLSGREFGADDEELLQLAADRIALAIDHARLYQAETAARAAAERAADQLTRLEAITEAALAHLSLDDLLGALLVRLRDLTGSDTVAVMLVDESGAELITRAALGLDDWLAGNPRMPLGEGFSGRIAAEARADLLVDVQGAPPEATALRSSGVGSLLGAPLVVEGCVLGVLTVGTWERRDFGAEDVRLLERAADRMALALEHARLYDAEHEARLAAEVATERLRRIEAITEVALHHIALDEEVLERLLSRVLEVLDADTAALFVTDDATQVAMARAPGGSSERVERQVELPEGRGFGNLVAERGQSVVVDDVSTVDIVSPMLREARVTSLLGVPLKIEGRLLGVLHIGTVGRRSFTDADLALLELAGERLAVALDRSRMYEREHFVAETLQRSLLPERLPELPGVAVAARYLPGEEEAVGGDWYDVLALRDGRVAVAMGDVVSRGVRAASVMGQLRNGLRAYAVEGHPPPAVLERLDAMTHAMDGSELATAVVAVLDPETGVLDYATAGHPPPLVVPAGGEPRLLEDGRGPPLGAMPHATFAHATAQVGPGDTVVLYTDGLVERRDMWIDEGLERLVVEAGRAAELRPDDLLARLVGGLLTGRADDDVAVLALRPDPVPGASLRLELTAEPDSLPGMRQSMRAWLAGAGAGEEECYDVLVATTEAAANSVEHAYGPGDATFLVEARRDVHGLVSVVVRDDGSWRPPRGQNRGRGTLLMQALMDDFEVTTGESGTEVRMAKRLTQVAAA